ncbi:MAG: SRPBCC family protein [Fimbriimonadaceae bacterium]|nr:SRPBCC family protein [Fimbriimonadaceae bacterium]
MDADALIHPEIAHAGTLPAWAYREPWFGRLRDTAFRAAWQFVGDDREVRIPGAIWPVTLLPDFLDEPIVFTRDMNDELRALSNVCTHRAMLVAESPGNARFLRCRYHGRRYGLNGEFQHMPEFEGVAGFPRPCDHLAPVPFGQWGPWLFAAIQPEVTFAETFAPMIDRLAWLPVREFVPDLAGVREYTVRAHWALYVENYLEGFHIPFVHSGLNEVIAYDSYETETFASGSLQIAETNDPGVAFDIPPGAPDAGRSIAAYYYWFFPNLMFNFYPWGLSVNVVRPIAPNLTKVTFLPYVWRADRRDHGAGSALDRVEREDEVIVEAVQRGLQSAFYPGGRFSVRREANVHDLHRRLAAWIARSSE